MPLSNNSYSPNDSKARRNAGYFDPKTGRVTPSLDALYTAPPPPAPLQNDQAYRTQIQLNSPALEKPRYLSQRNLENFSFPGSTQPPSDSEPNQINTARQNLLAAKNASHLNLQAPLLEAPKRSSNYKNKENFNFQDLIDPDIEIKLGQKRANKYENWNPNAKDEFAAPESALVHFQCKEYTDEVPRHVAEYTKNKNKSHETFNYKMK
ncbi:Hypothetical_protein [Hexamita inflata]|uniref:Hypothetical_protein n=1 Tax=Hexamita inflata TaxID=28002 RepID=A0AA86TFV6_9EUKA|nr:Hypothetical protein HINF_LOCUS2702 [Hexamita inflata]